MLAVTWITEVILELIHAKNLDSRRDAFIRSKPNGFGCLILMTLNYFESIVCTHYTDPHSTIQNLGTTHINELLLF